MNSNYLDHIVVESTNNLHFVLIDTSTYNPDLPTPVTYYDVFVPNFSTAVSLQYTPEQNLVINSTVLGRSAFDDFQTLEDGLWIITQKIVEGASGEQTVCYTSKNYFRINKLKNQILTKIQEALDDCDCKLVDKYYSHLQDLELSKMLAENLCDTKRAIILFNAISNEFSGCQPCSNYYTTNFNCQSC